MLFCITANYTAKALTAMRENPNTNRREAVEQLVKAAGGKLVAMYGTMTEGPGVLVIIDVDPVAAAAITGTVASSDAVHSLKMTRLWSQDEITAVRQKRVQLHGSYKAPGQ
jgi:uncharacterized protein with GYD domain